MNNDNLAVVSLAKGRKGSKIITVSMTSKVFLLQLDETFFILILMREWSYALSGSRFSDTVMDSFPLEADAGPICLCREVETNLLPLSHGVCGVAVKVLRMSFLRLFFLGFLCSFCEIEFEINKKAVDGQFSLLADAN